MPGIEPGASYMQSMRSTTELHPPSLLIAKLNIQITRDVDPELVSKDPDPQLYIIIIICRLYRKLYFKLLRYL